MRGIFICFFCCCFVYAQELPSPGDFARGYRIITTEDAAIYHLKLDADIYKTVTDQNLGDIRVFNKNNEVIPHVIRRPGKTVRSNRIKAALPVFPLFGDTVNVADDGNLDISIAEDGTITQIKSAGNFSVEENIRIDSYLIDISKNRHRIDTLEFDLLGVDENFLKQATLEYSHDLNNWLPLINSFSIANMQYGSYSLRQDMVELPAINAAYLRFKWLDPPGNAQLGNVYAYLDQVDQQDGRIWQKLTGEFEENSDSRLLFDSTGYFPVDSVNIVLPEENSLIEATLKSRNDISRPWKTHRTDIFYRLKMNGNQLRNGFVKISPTLDRYWLLDIKSRDGSNLKPALEIGWVPNEIYFLARGEGPYVLAYGNASIEQPEQPVSRLMQVLTTNQQGEFVGKALLGVHVTLKGDAALSVKTELPWQRILLWSLLVLGVIIMGIIAYRLFRQINSDS